jgi:hypothetical protein
MRTLFALHQLSHESLKLIHHSRRYQSSGNSRRQSFADIAFCSHHMDRNFIYR